MNEINPEIQARIDRWLSSAFDEKTRSAVTELLKNQEELIDAFYTTLSFGTGGLRSLMGVGTNRMNDYTVSAATQGVSNYLKKTVSAPLSVFIGYDSRHHSKEFAEECAKVLAANKIHVYLCKEIRPTPFVSFGCRFKKCSAAIMITASHNPKEYNGYKVYWNDGAQVLPPHDVGIIDEVNKITKIGQIQKVADPHIEYVGEDLDDAYLKAIQPLLIYQEENKNQGHTLHAIYTSLHGTGITLIPQAFKNAGFSNISYVEKQCIPDGDFPTVKSPNPEEKAALQLGIDMMHSKNGDLLIANDPDADRVGVAVKHQNQTIVLNGNQIACILLNHICEGLTATHKMPKRAAFIKTIVTTELFKAIVESYEKKCFEVLTGFKYIAEKIREWENDPNAPEYIFGAEESYGYLFGTLVRDKDAISTSLLIMEAALLAKLQGKTLIDKLYEIYKKHGCFIEDVISVKFEETKAGKEAMQKGMDNLEKNPPVEINGIKVIAIEKRNKSKKSDMLIFWLEDGSKLIIRPSGTEPKIKIYGGVSLKEFDNIDNAIKACKEKVLTLCNALKTLF